MLAPPGWGPMAAWFTGWSNWLGQVTGAPSVNYGNSAMLLAAASIAYPDYTPQNYQVFLLTCLLMLTHGCISSMPTLWIARFNSYGSTFNMIGLVVVIIMIPPSIISVPKFNPSRCRLANSKLHRLARRNCRVDELRGFDLDDVRI